MALFASIGVGTGPSVPLAMESRSDHIWEVRLHVVAEIQCSPIELRSVTSLNNPHEWFREKWEADTDVDCALNDPSEIVLCAAHGGKHPPVATDD